MTGEHRFMSLDPDLKVAVVIGIHGFLRIRGTILSIPIISDALREIDPILKFLDDGSFVTPISLRDAMVDYLKARGLQATPSPSLN